MATLFIEKKAKTIEKRKKNEKKLFFGIIFLYTIRADHSPFGNDRPATDASVFHIRDHSMQYE